MGYTHFKGLSVTEHGYAVGPKGSEITVIDASGNVTLQNGAVTQIHMKTRGEVALSDADATLTASQLLNSAIFKITPTQARTLTTPTAAALVAALPGVQAGNWFEFIIVNLASYNVTLQGGSGVTIVGSAVVNNSSARFIGLFTNTSSGNEAVIIYRS